MARTPSREAAVLLTHKQVAAQLSISPSKLYALVASDAFPKPIRIGRSARYIVTEVETWIAARAEERCSHREPEVVGSDGR